MLVFAASLKAILFQDVLRRGNLWELLASMHTRFTGKILHGLWLTAKSMRHHNIYGAGS